MDVAKTAIDGMLVLTPGREGRDGRGVVRELFRASDFAAAVGSPPAWQQVNATETVPGAVPGLHGEPMTKFVRLAWGEACRGSRRCTGCRRFRRPGDGAGKHRRCFPVTA